MRLNRAAHRVLIGSRVAPALNGDNNLTFKLKAGKREVEAVVFFPDADGGEFGCMLGDDFEDLGKGDALAVVNKLVSSALFPHVAYAHPGKALPRRTDSRSRGLPRRPHPRLRLRRHPPLRRRRASSVRAAEVRVSPILCAGPDTLRSLRRLAQRINRLVAP